MGSARHADGWRAAERPYWNRIELARNWCKGRVGMPFPTNPSPADAQRARAARKSPPSGDGSG